MFKTNGCIQSLEKNKKGISNLVASVLLIVFVVSLGLIVINWSGKMVGGSVEKSKIKIGTDLECSNVEVKLEGKAGAGGGLIIKNNNRNKMDIKGFITRFITDEKAVVDYANKESEIKGYGAFLFPYESSDKRTVTGEPVVGLDMGDVKQIEIIPRVDIGEEIVDCETRKARWKV